MAGMYHCCLLLGFLLSVRSQFTPFDYHIPNSCSVNEFYNFVNLSCVSCPANSLRSDNGYTCNGCTEANTVVKNNYFCLKCSPPLTYENGACSGCSRTSIFVDILPVSNSSVGNRTCIPCQNGTWADESQTVCIPCGISDCTNCIVYDGLCVGTELPTSSSQPFQFYNDYYAISLYLCQRYRNRTACQVLINLCVLQLYDKNDDACKQVIQLADSYPDDVPHLYYPEFGADEYLTRTTINTPLATTATISVVAAQFSLNGSFLGLTNISDQIMLCKDRPSRSSYAWIVGVQYEIKCLLTTLELLQDGLNPIFFDLFLLDGGQLVPIPILLDNYRDSNTGLMINKGDTAQQWQFVRRFYLFQSLTSTPLRIENLELNIQLTTNGYIQPPYVRVSYGTIPTTGSVQTSFNVQYKSNGNDFNIGLSVSCFVLVFVSIVYTGFKINGFMRRNGCTCCELKTFVYMIVQFGSITATLWLLLLTIASMFWLVLFKSQILLFVALPYGDQEIAFIVLLVLSFVLRSVEVIYLIWKQSTIEIFLIDWEKPSLPEGSSDVTPTSVSIWRTYFIANEWNEIQTLRKLNPTLLLVFVLLFLEVVGLKNLAEIDPSPYITVTSERYSAPHSLILRFSLGIVLYLMFALLLRLYMFLIHERYICNQIQQFVDLCSISNISIFILSDAFFGHYIHGRSVHGKSDTNMREMNENLIKEKEDRCGKRGLDNSDEQIFQVAITPTFRIQYYQIKTPLNAERASGQIVTGITEAGLKTYEELTSFLTSFLEHNKPNCDYVIKHKLLVEKALQMEFYNPVEHSFFYSRSGYSFTDVLFYGNEWCLLSFEMLLFLVVDLAGKNFVLAAAITYLSSKVLSLVRGALGQNNLGKKTLVDNRFII